jgi:hypothetical protein
MQNECWSPKLIFNLCVERINNLKSSDKAFTNGVNLIDMLYSQDQLLIGLDTKNQNEFFFKFAISNEQIQILTLLLGLDPLNSEFHFIPNFLDMNNNKIIRVGTRSFMKNLLLFSKGVKVLQEDIQKGFVAESMNETLGKMITINYPDSHRRHQNTFVCDFYRENGFILPIMI